MASGRWVPGTPDPLRFVAGDVVSIRGIATTGAVTKAAAILLPEKRPPGLPTHGDSADIDHDVAIEQLWPLFQVGALYEAQSYFLPVDSALGILASQPPTPEMLTELHLPYPKVAVYFGADLVIPSELLRGAAGDEESYRRTTEDSARASARYGLTPPADVLGSIARSRGYLSGVVLFEDDGGLADEVVWILAGDEPPPDDKAALDRARGTAMGLRSRSSLDPLVANLAAAVSWGDWQPPEATLVLPANPESSAWQEAVRSGRFRRQEPRGGFADVRVLDVARMHARARPPHGPQSGEGHASPVTHLRRGHWKRVRVGPKNDWSYSPRWIPPVVVNPTNAARTPVRVYRLGSPG